MQWLMLVAAIAQIFAIFGVTAYARHAILTEKRKAAEQLRAFVEAPAEGKLSPLAEFTELVSARLAAHLIAQVKEFIRVQGSAVARQEQSMQGEMFTEAVNAQNPLVGMLMSQFPALGKRLAKNPSALPALMNLLGNARIGGAAAIGTKSNGESVAGRIKNQA
jgi:hypothetical protein